MLYFLCRMLGARRRCARELGLLRLTNLKQNTNMMYNFMKKCDNYLFFYPTI